MYCTVYKYVKYGLAGFIKQPHCIILKVALDHGERSKVRST